MPTLRQQNEKYDKVNARTLVLTPTAMKNTTKCGMSCDLQNLMKTQNFEIECILCVWRTTPNVQVRMDDNTSFARLTTCLVPLQRWRFVEDNHTNALCVVLAR